MASTQEILDRVNALRRSPVEEIKEILADNFREIWATQGEAIDSDWNGNDLVGTGYLRSYMTDLNQYQATEYSVLVSVPEKYRALNDRYPFVGLTRNSYKRLESIAEYRGIR